jgi:hypothetical protein
MQIPNFVGPSYTLASTAQSLTRAVNFYPELSESATKNAEQYHYIPTPGLRLLYQLSGGAGRGCYTAANKRSFCVNGRNVYEITTPSVPVLVGTLDEAPTGPVSVTDNGIQLLITSNGAGYILDFATNVLTPIVQDAMLTMGDAAFIDGYFVICQPNSRQFNLTAIFDGTSLNGLDEAQKQTQPDNLLTVVESFELACFIGERSSEAWRNTGASDFPFERQMTIEVGTAAKDTVRKLDGYPIFVATDTEGKLSVVHFYGFQPKRVSNHAIETALNAVKTTIGSASAWTYAAKGHSFYCLNLPNSNVTWVYDSLTGLWHERTYTDASLGSQRHRAEHHCVIGGKHVVQDYANGNLYELTDDVLTDNGAAITRDRVFMLPSQEGKRITAAALQIDIEAGVGLDGGVEGADPQMMYRHSNDGGRNWSDWRTASMGKIGETLARVVFRRLGMYRQRTVQVRVTDPVKVSLISAFLDATASSN